jgi:hypothetical protein
VPTDVAWIDVLPTGKGFIPALDKILGGAIPGAGKKAGDQYGQAFGDAATAKIEQSSDRMAAAQRKAEDAAGRHSVALSKLQDLVAKGTASASQLAAANENVARSSRAVEAAQDGVSRAETNLARARSSAAQSTDEHTGAIGRMRAGMQDLELQSRGLDRTSNTLSASLGRMGTVGAVALGALGSQAAVGGVVALAGAVGTASGAILLLPAAAVAVAAPLATFKLGLVGVDDAFKALNDGKMDKFEEALAKMAPSAAATFREVAQLKPAFDDLRTSIQQEMFEGLARFVQPLGAAYFPMLRTELGLFAQIMNGATTEVAQFLLKGSTVGDIATILRNVRAAFGEVEQAAAPIVGIFVDIGVVGSTFIPGLTAGFTDLAIKTADWVARARETGVLHDIMSAALSVLGQLGQIVLNVGSIIVSVFQASAGAGAGFLDIIKNATGELAAFLNSDYGQTMLAEAFRAVGAAIGAVMPLIGIVAGIILGQLVPAFAGLGLQLAPVAQVLLVQLGYAIGQLTPILPLVGQAIIAIVNAFIPWIPLLAQAAIVLLPPLLAAITALAPVIVPLAGTIFVLVQAMHAFNAVQTLVTLATGAWSGAQLVAKGATAAWTGAQWLLNAALTANPISLVIIGLVALGAALVLAWQHSETFRGIVTAAFDGIKAAWDWVWQAIQTGWGYIKLAWDAVAAAGVWLWQTILVPAFNGIMAAWNAVLSGIQWAWDNILRPVWDAISIAAQYLLAVLAVMVFAPILIAWNLLSAGIQLAYNNIIQPTWNFLQMAAQGLWIFLQGVWMGMQIAWNALAMYWQYIYATVIQPLWNTIQMVMEGVGIFLRGVWTGLQIAWQALSDWFTYIYNTRILPLWNALQAAAMFMWNSVLRPTWDLIMRGFQAVGDFFVWVYNVIVQPLWNRLQQGAQNMWNNFLRPTFDLIMRGFRAVGDFFQWVYDHVIQPAWDAVARSLTWLKDRFQDAVNWIRDIWNGIKRVLAVPINFMINTVWNGGIVPAWNMVADLLPGVGKLRPAAPIAEAATGGQVTGGGVNNYANGGQLQGRWRGPTADNLLGVVDNKVPVKLTPREWIHPVASGQKYGDPFMRSVQKGTFPEELAQLGSAPGLYRRTDRVRKDDIRERYATGGKIPGFAQGTIVDMGRILQGMGAKVTEHPAFGGVAMGGHGRSSLHYTGHAIDVNTRPGTSALEQRELAPMAALARSKGFRTIFMAPDHYNHLHVDDGGGGPIGAIGDWIADVAGELKAKVVDLFAKPARAFVDKIGDRPPPAFNDIPRKMGNFLIDKAVEMFNGKADEQGAATGYAPIGTGVGPVADQVRSAATLRGWGAGGQWNALDWVISHESGWNPNAQNPVSSASGLFQFIDGTWRAYRPPQAAGFAKMRNAPPNLQAAAGMNYIGSRYKDPVGAKAFWVKNHWYSGGGQIPTTFDKGGIWRAGTLGFNAGGSGRGHRGGADERVLTAPQDNYWRRFTDTGEQMLRQLGQQGSGRKIAENITIHAEGPDAALQAVDKLYRKIRLHDRGGVYTDVTTFSS